MARIMVAGPYGGANLGDELILHFVANQLQELGHSVVATSMNPRHTKQYHGLDAVPVLEYRKWQLKSLSTLRNCDALVIGGGEQLSEPRIPNPLWGLLARVAHLTRFANWLGKPVMLWSVGVDKVRSPIGPWLLRHWVRPNAIVTVRDPDSFQRLLGMGFTEKQISLTSDPVFLMEAVDRAKGRKYLQSLICSTEDRPTLLLIPANDRYVSLGYLDALINGCLKAVKHNGGRIVVKITDLQATYDRRLLQRPELAQSDRLAWLPTKSYSPKELALIFAGADVVVSARMHPLIMAETQGTPWINIARSSKMESFGKMMDKRWFQIDSLSETELCQTLRSVFSSSQPHCQANLKMWKDRAKLANEIFRERIRIK